MNERLIYEWLRPELKGAPWHKGSARLGPMAYIGSDTSQWFYIPKLDMNTWHGEVVPKLKQEGASICFHSTNGCPWEVDGDGYGCSDDPWLALTAYLEAGL